MPSPSDTAAVSGITGENADASTSSAVAWALLESGSVSPSISREWEKSSESIVNMSALFLLRDSDPQFLADVTNKTG
jgi:hypothetical protein